MSFQKKQSLFPTKPSKQASGVSAECSSLVQVWPFRFGLKFKLAYYLDTQLKSLSEDEIKVWDA